MPDTMQWRYMRVAPQRAIIGLVVADHQIGYPHEAPASSGATARWSLSQSTAACQGRGTPFQDGVKECSDRTSGALPLDGCNAAIVSATAWW